MYFSSYEDRLKQTPSEESGRWNGQRGESKCAPQSEESKRILKEKGIDGIEYKDGVPDFSPVSESTVKIPKMNSERSSLNVRDGRDNKNTVYYNPQEGSSSHTADKSSMAHTAMKYENPGNFDQANILTAQRWTQEKKDGKEWSAQDVENYRKQNNLTWHECSDGETMQLVPSEINKDFGHLGGTAEMKRREQIISEVETDLRKGKVSYPDDSERTEVKPSHGQKWNEQVEKWSKIAQEYKREKPREKTKSQENTNKM